MPQKIADDVLAEILLRLPSIAAGRFRWASKYLLSLTSDPRFVRTYYNLHPSPPLAGVFLNRVPYGVTFLPFSNDRRSPSVSIPDPPCMRNPPVVLSSCNGLILRCHGPSGFILFVCNPSNGIIHVIPKPSTPAAEDPHAITYHLAFDLTTSSASTGIVGGGMFHDFTVVTVVSIDPSNPPMFFNTYSSATGEWRQSAAAFIGNPDEDEYFPCSRSGVYFNGCMYWIHGNNHSLHVFHMADERLSLISLPPLPENTYNTFIRDFSASGCGLHVTIEYCREESNDNVSKIRPFNVWEMNGECSGWNLLYSFTTLFRDDLLYSKKYMTPWMFLRGEGEGEEKHDMLLLHVFNGPFLLYNIDDHTFKETETLSRDCEPRSWFSVHIFRYLPF